MANFRMCPKCGGVMRSVVREIVTHGAHYWVDVWVCDRPKEYDCPR